MTPVCHGLIVLAALLPPLHTSRPSPTAGPAPAPPPQLAQALPELPTEAVPDTTETTSAAEPEPAPQVTPPVDQLPLAPQENRQFRLAVHYWNDGSCQAAAATLERFLKDHPESKLAPEAAYRLAACYQFEGKASEAKKAFDQVIRSHLFSTWGALAVLQYGEKGLIEMADGLRASAREPGKGKDALKALVLYQRHEKHYSRGGEVKADAVAYKLGDCYLLNDEPEKFQAAMERVRDLGKGSSWGKLAAARLAGQAGFLEHADELIALATDGNEEAMRLFVDLAEKALPTLTGEDRARCLLHQALYLPYARKSEAIALCQTVLREHANSSWAPVAAFCIAERSFGEHAFAKARAAYLDMAGSYPDDARARVAAKWAGWIDHRTAGAEELEQALFHLACDLIDGQGALAFRLQGTSDDPARCGDFDFACRPRTEEVYLKLRYGGGGVTACSRKDSSWYHVQGSTRVIRTGEPLFWPRFRLRDLGGSGKINAFACLATIPPSDDDPTVDLATDLISTTVIALTTDGHFHRTVHVDSHGRKRPVFVVQVPTLESSHPAEVRVQLTSRGKVEKIRLSWWDPKGKRNSWTLSHLQLGESVPDEIFNAAPPAGLAVSTVQQVDPNEALWSVMHEFVALGNDLTQVLNQARR